MKKVSGFWHDFDAENDYKMVALRKVYGWEGFGLYWAIISRICRNRTLDLERNYGLIAFDLRVSNEKIRSIVEDFELFEMSEDGKRFFSRRLRSDQKTPEGETEEMEERSEESNKDLVVFNSNCKKVKIEEREDKDNDKKSPITTTSRRSNTTTIYSSINNDKKEEKEKEKEESARNSSTQGRLGVWSEKESRCRLESMNEWAPEEWLEAIAMKNRLASVADVRGRFGEFVLSVKSSGKVHASEQDLKAHFAHWVRRMIEKEQQEIKHKKERKYGNNGTGGREEHLNVALQAMDMLR